MGNCLNAENEIDIRAMKKDAEQYNMPSAWFKNRYEEILDTCYEMATNLPESLDKQGIVTGDFGTVNMGRIKSFMGCCKNAKQKLCWIYYHVWNGLGGRRDRGRGR